MKALIEIALVVIAAYCGYVWVQTVRLHNSQQSLHSFSDLQITAIGAGVSAILCLGFLGLLL